MGPIERNPVWVLPASGARMPGALASARCCVHQIVGQCIAVRLRMLNRVVSKIYDDALRHRGIKVSQLNILVATAKMGTAHPADLCEGLQGEPDLRITAGADSWLGFLRGEKSIFWALIRRKVRLKGPLRLLLAFGLRLAPDTGADCRFARKLG